MAVPPAPVFGMPGVLLLVVPVELLTPVLGMPVEVALLLEFVAFVITDELVPERLLVPDVSVPVRDELVPLL